MPHDARETTRETFVRIGSATDHAQMLALSRRIIRKTDAMKSACIGRAVSASDVTRDAEEIRILASMIEQRLGGEHA